MSEYTCRVFPFKKKKHPNADSLFISQVGDTDYQVVCRIQDWDGIDHFCWIEPETLVPVDRSEFSFLSSENKFDEHCQRVKGGYALVKLKKLRGETSFGMAVPVPAEQKDDYFGHFGLIHYNMPVLEKNFGHPAQGPKFYVPTYDLENLRKFPSVLSGEVIASLKLHGENCRVVYHDGQMYVGSRNNWKKREEGYDLNGIAEKMKVGGKSQEEIDERIKDLSSREKSVSHFWLAAENDPRLFDWCKKNPDHVVFGESYGNNASSGFAYDTNGKRKFRAFDIYYNGKFLDYDEARKADIEWVPEVYRGPYDLELFKSKIEERCPFNNGVCEGWVVQPLKEMTDRKGNRMKFKIVSNSYLEK